MANKKNTKKNHHEDAPEKKHAQSNNKGIKIRYEWGKKKKIEGEEIFIATCKIEIQ